MILKELHLTDALGRISIFPPLTHNGEVRILTWPQVIDISKIRDIQIVGTSGLIKFWKIEKILLRTVAVARAYTFLEVRSRDSTWWPDLMWPRHKNFTTDVKLINEKVCQVWLRCSLSFSSYPRKTTGGGQNDPPPTRAKVKHTEPFGGDIAALPFPLLFNCLTRALLGLWIFHRLLGEGRLNALPHDLGSCSP